MQKKKEKKKGQDRKNTGEWTAFCRKKRRRQERKGNRTMDRRFQKKKKGQDGKNNGRMA